MTEDPQSRFEHDLALDPRLDSDAREGLTGTARADAYESAAARAHRKERSSSPSTARQEVRDLVTSNIRNFSRKETADVAGFIDACPTLEEE